MRKISVYYLIVVKALTGLNLFCGNQREHLVFGCKGAFIAVGTPSLSCAAISGNVLCVKEQSGGLVDRKLGGTAEHGLRPFGGRGLFFLRSAPENGENYFT